MTANIHTPWGRIRLMLRLLWQIHRKSLVNALGISAVIGFLIGLISLLSYDPIEGRYFWHLPSMLAILSSSIAVSWCWGTYCLSQTVHRMVGTSFVALPLSLREKCIAIALYLFGGSGLFVLLSHVVMALLAIYTEGASFLGVFTDRFHDLSTFVSEVYSSVVAEDKFSIAIALTIAGVLQPVLDMSLSVWSFVRFEGYIKAFFIRLVGMFVISQLIYTIGVSLESVYSWQASVEQDWAGNLWVMIAVFSALTALLLWNTASYLRRIDK